MKAWKWFKEKSKWSKVLLILGIITISFGAGGAIFYGVDKEATIVVYNQPVSSTSDLNYGIYNWSFNPLCIASDEFAASQNPRGLQYWNYLNKTAPGLFKYARIHNVF